jgi:multidrug efflux pump subunit AcrB
MRPPHFVGILDRLATDYARNFIRPQLSIVQGAATTSPYGDKVRQIQIDLDQAALRAHRLSAQDVVAARAQQNLNTVMSQTAAFIDRPTNQRNMML